MCASPWPWQYNFPPFFTIQPNRTTQEKQIEAWCSLVLDYCQRNKVYSLDLIEAHQSELFNNKDIHRQLPLEGVNLVFEKLHATGHAEWLDPKQKRRCHIYWRRPEEWANLLYAWISANSLKGAICTFYELVEADDTAQESFHKLDRSILIKALKKLVQEGKAELLLAEEARQPGHQNELFVIQIDYGDCVIIYLNYRQMFALKVQAGKDFQLKYGQLKHDDLVGKQFGSKIQCSRGYVYALHPSPELWTQNLQHRTQILYTADISVICSGLDLAPGSIVVEAGTGSGSLSHAIARAVAPNGHLHTFDFHLQRVEIARKEFADHQLAHLVTVAQRDVCKDGFGVTGSVDAVFLDVPKPWEAIAHVKTALKAEGGRFCAFSPCIEQTMRTSELLAAEGFEFIETLECLLRTYKTFELNEITMDELKGRKLTLPRGERSRKSVKNEAVAETAAVQEGTDLDQAEPANKLLKTEAPRCSEASRNGNLGSAVDARREEEGAAVSLAYSVFPVEQPTHTGYLTFASLLRQ